MSVSNLQSFVQTDETLASIPLLIDLQQERENQKQILIFVLSRVRASSLASLFLCSRSLLACLFIHFIRVTKFM
jgi:hypothetical protein